MKRRANTRRAQPRAASSRLCAFVLSLVAIWPMAQATAADGTLVVDVTPRSAAGQRWLVDFQSNNALRQRWKSSGARTIWVYAWSAGAEAPAKHLLGARRLTADSVTPAQPVTARVPAGDYGIDVVVAGDSTWPAFTVGCQTSVTVRANAESRIAMPGRDCTLTSATDTDVWAMSMNNDDQRYAHMALGIANMRNRCASLAEPLNLLHQRARANPPREPVVFIREYWLARDGGTYPDRTLYARDVDGEHVRRMVEALKYWCWQSIYPELWHNSEDTSLPADELSYKQRIRGIIEAEMRKLEQINGLADALDSAARR